jgi:hypothetical protein
MCDSYEMPCYNGQHMLAACLRQTDRLCMAQTAGADTIEQGPLNANWANLGRQYSGKAIAVNELVSPSNNNPGFVDLSGDDVKYQAMVSVKKDDYEQPW